MTLLLNRIPARLLSMPLPHLPAFMTPFTPIPRSPVVNSSFCPRTLERKPVKIHRAVHHTPESSLKPTSRPSRKPPSEEGPSAETPTPKFLRRATKGALSNVSQFTPLINWYPGHIAKAERALKNSIKLVDVVIEVRDCRIPISTQHPSVPEWLGNRTHILALNRADLAPVSARSAWRAYFQDKGEAVRFVNARQGRGVKELRKVAVEAGASVNERRKKRGLLPRPVRCLVIGYPNVGKSALINKLVGKNTAKSANKPGVTRNYQWIRISDTIELLDMPGIIPAKFVSQEQALRLAICDDIGQAAYESQIIASKMVEELKRIVKTHPTYFSFETIVNRFGVDPTQMSGEDYLDEVANRVCKGDLERTAVRLLTEFRAGVLGPATLESPDMLGERSTDRSSAEDDVAR